MELVSVPDRQTRCNIYSAAS